MSGNRTLAVVVALGLLWWPLAANLRGQVTPASDDKLLIALSARMDSFFDAVSTGKTQTAYVNLLIGSPLLKQEEQLSGLVRKTGEIDKSFGAYRGIEQILARRVGKDLVLMRYLYKCENFPVVWHVAFYRDQRETRVGETQNGAESWRVIQIRFDTDLEALAR